MTNPITFGARRPIAITMLVAFLAWADTPDSGGAADTQSAEVVQPAFSCGAVLPRAASLARAIAGNAILAPPSAIGEKRILLYRVDFSNVAGAAISSNAAASLFVELNNYYRDMFDSMGVPGGSTSHFNARFKNLLGWIPDSDAPVITANGTFRITAHDHPAASGVRALRITRNSSQNYWVEFRQAFSNRWVTNGATLRWAGNDATNTLLLDTGSPPGSRWADLEYDDAAWQSGAARLGYGVGGEATTVSYGPNESDRHISTWFRHRFVLEDAAAVDHLVFSLRRDDGAVVFLNGRELFRENLPVGVIQASTPALADVSTGEEQAFFKRLIASSGLVTGTNVLAVEIHQFRTNSVDLSFDLELVGMTDRPEALRPRLKIKHAAADVALSWPAAHNGSLLYTARTLHTAEAWAQSTAPVLLSNGWNNVYISPSHDGGFYQLRKPGFCTPSP